jgi:hypothetical protein
VVPENEVDLKIEHQQRLKTMIFYNFEILFDRKILKAKIEVMSKNKN